MRVCNAVFKERRNGFVGFDARMISVQGFPVIHELPQDFYYYYFQKGANICNKKLFCSLRWGRSVTPLLLI
jgi:hypothetical protein